MMRRKFLFLGVWGLGKWTGVQFGTECFLFLTGYGVEVDRGIFFFFMATHAMIAMCTSCVSSILNDVVYICIDSQVHWA
ncbi:hypothetical protein DER45DRAFT_554616 [Fusarium avenaceum]|nr:hypothetical protein DER45DRAFT_554616 [Fusarium avenaceum]